MRKRIVRIVAVVLVLLVILVVGLGFYVRGQLRGSLAQLDGEAKLAGLSAPVTVARDDRGIPTIRGENRLDVAYALGFVHGQERFFQMDLLRRNSAGELAEIVGEAALPLDKPKRMNRFRDVARRVVEGANADQREMLEAYAAGVNAGLAALPTKPFEYLVLGAEPAPWKAEDSGLVLFSMYLDLQGEDYRDETTLGVMHDVLPEPMFDFLAPRGTEWDAPIQGEAFQTPPIPGPEVFDTRKLDAVAVASLRPLDAAAPEGPVHFGSNNWAVSGKRTKDGRAIVADDMHLGIRVPHIWYRAALEWPVSEGSDQKRNVTGVSLPGTPGIVVGSNGHVAWAFTNSEGDWVDVVIVEVDPNDKDSYLTPDGPRKFGHEKEVLKIAGKPDETLEVVTTIWGPVKGTDHDGRPRVERWVAYDTEGVNMGLLKMETADTLEDAMRQANLSGSPAQNFVVADDQGHIAWTIMGRIPRRVGFDGRLPSSWADGKHRWDGYLAPEDYPRVVDPEDGRIWTANARVVSGDMLATLGDGGYDLGARAQQIRDDMRAKDEFTEADMLRIQLDDRAVFLSPCKKVDEKFSIAKLDRTEGPVWRLVSEQPEHLIDPRYKDWDSLLLAAADQVISDATKNGAKLADFTWGNHNTTKIQHPLSGPLWPFASWLDMPAQPLSGDSENIPRIQAPAMGASQRMGVSPGHEQEGYMHMPCGQSGHPLSPYYRVGHSSWVEGKAEAFLPGEAAHTLTLKPAG